MRSTVAWNGEGNEKKDTVMRSLVCTVIFRSATALGAVYLAATLAVASEGLVLRGPQGGEVRGLVIGIDAYRNFRALRGAVADARDIENALRRMGTKDVTTLIDGQADRASILREIDRLTARTQANDLVVLSIAGHGTQEEERVRGSEPDGMENVFLLPDFALTAAGSQQRILGKEFNHFIKQLELRGARVVFVADTCHGGGMAREIDPRAEEMSYRQVPSFKLTNDTLKPVTTNSEAFMTELDFDHTEFLAAVDRKTKAPEISIPGVPGLRGALSYAVARAFEGNADANNDGKVTVNELFTNVRQMVYQLSNQRQNIVTVSSPSRDRDTDTVFEFTRGVSVIEPAAAPALRPATAPAATSATAPQVRTLPATAAFERPIRLAALDGDSSHFADLVPREAKVEIVKPADNPDIIWDPASHDVIAWGDVIAFRIDKSDLPSIVDRAAAVRALKQFATNAPQLIKIGPDDTLHRNESLVQIELSEVAGRSLIMFNIAGDGTVQMLYPIGSDLAQLQAKDFRFPLRVREPFGADQIVAVTSSQRMTELEQVLLQLNRRRAATQMIKLVERYAPQDARIGSAGLFTAP
jgi:hypothetical protein